MGESVAPLGQQCGPVRAQVGFQKGQARRALGEDRTFRVAFLDQALCVLQALQQLQRQPSGGTALGQLLVALDLSRQLQQLRFDIVPVAHGHGSNPRVLFLGHRKDRALQLLHALGAVADGRDHGAAQQGLQRLQVDLDALALCVVHHVQHEHDGAPQFQQLRRQVEVALQIGGIQHVDDEIWLRAGEVAAGNAFVFALGRKAVRAGQIHHLDILAIQREESAAALDGDARPVAHVVPRPGERVEDGGLAAIGIASECDDAHERSGVTRMQAPSSRRRDRW